MMGMRIPRVCSLKMDLVEVRERGLKRGNHGRTLPKERDSPSRHGLKDDRKQVEKSGWRP